MAKSTIELDEEKAKNATSNPPKREKKPRRISVKNPSFFLYKADKDDGSLSRIGSFETEADICSAFESALDNGSSEDELVGFRGRFLKFEVKETKRRIAVW